jgi:hypothetical protein
MNSSGGWRERRWSSWKLNGLASLDSGFTTPTPLASFSASAAACRSTE